MKRAPSEPFGVVASMSPLAGRSSGAPALPIGSGIPLMPLAWAAFAIACHSARLSASPG